MAYADEEYYENTYGGGVIDIDRLHTRLEEASVHIDSLTFGRIKGFGFSNLTEFQQEKIRMVCCKLADWEYQNAEALSGALTSYSINGVSMSFSKSFGVTSVNGVVAPKSILAELSQTGLTTGGRVIWPTQS